MIRAVLFSKLQTAILGPHYDLSVAFLSSEKMREVTKRTKNKNKASNVLAFSLSKNSGEILLCKETADAEAEKFYMTKRVYLAFLFIHGLLHLRGMDHGDTMEDEERRIMKQFGLRRNE